MYQKGFTIISRVLKKMRMFTKVLSINDLPHWLDAFNCLYVIIKHYQYIMVELELIQRKKKQGEYESQWKH